MDFKKLKVLIIGSNSIWSIERYYIKYLKEAGVDTYLFEAQNKFTAYYNKSTLNKVLFKAGMSSFFKTMNEELKQYADQVQPDVIWVFKGMEVMPATLQYFKKKNIFLVNYNPDNPFIFSGKGSGNSNVTDSIGLYDLHFTYNHEIQDQIVQQYKLPVEILPFGFDVSDDIYNTCAGEPEIVKTCFIGNPDKERAAFINEVANEVPVDLYGYHWNDYVSHKNATIYPPALGDDIWKVLRQYRVQLNIMRPHNLDSHNMRTFEIPGIGGIMIAPATTEHKQYFEDGKDAILFNDVKECIAKVHATLLLPEVESNKIRQKARATSLAKGYSYKCRTELALKLIEKHALKNG